MLQIVFAWIKRVAWQRRIPIQQIRETYATILTYGSYGLGVRALFLLLLFEMLNLPFFFLIYFFSWQIQNCISR